MKQNKAILINPSNLQVSEVMIPDHYTCIQNIIECRCFTCIRIDEKNTAFVDDEGLLNGTAYGTRLKNYPEPIAGNIVILGENGMGESCDTSLSADEVKHMIECFLVFPNNLDYEKQ